MYTAVFFLVALVIMKSFWEVTWEEKEKLQHKKHLVVFDVPRAAQWSYSCTFYARKKEHLVWTEGPHPCLKDALFLIVKFITWPDEAESIEIIIEEWEWAKPRSPVSRFS